MCCDDPDDLVAVVESAGYGARLPAPPATAGEQVSPDDPVQRLRQRLLVSLVLTVPVVAMAMVPALQFTNWQWLSLTLAAPVVVWGALPFHRAAWANLRHGSSTMDTLISMGTLYYLIPRLFGQKQMYSVKAIEAHFWVATIGIVLYIAAMWIAGVMQGLMWRETNDDGTLTYTFVEALKATYPYYVVRLAGGLLVLGGTFIMAWNMWKTFASVRKVEPVVVPIPAQA